MRTIKFRAWDNQLNQWARGKDLDYANILNFPVNDYFIKDGHEVDRWSFSQFTGLHDKNGKEIYEGDIVQMHSEFYNVLGNDDNNFDRDYIGEIAIQASRGTVLKRPKWHCNITDEDGRDNFYKPITAIRSEVIGNIYENPELLTPQH